MYHIRCTSHTTLQFTQYLPGILNKPTVTTHFTCKTVTRRCMSGSKLCLSECQLCYHHDATAKSDGNRTQINCVGVLDTSHYTIAIHVWLPISLQPRSNKNINQVKGLKSKPDSPNDIHLQQRIDDQVQNKTQYLVKIKVYKEFRVSCPFGFGVLYEKSCKVPDEVTLLDFPGIGAIPKLSGWYWNIYHVIVS